MVYHSDCGITTVLFMPKIILEQALKCDFMHCDALFIHYPFLNLVVFIKWLHGSDTECPNVAPCVKNLWNKIPGNWKNRMKDFTTRLNMACYFALAPMKASTEMTVSNVGTVHHNFSHPL